MTNVKGNTEQYLCYGVIVLAAYHKVLYMIKNKVWLSLLILAAGLEKDFLLSHWEFSIVRLQKNVLDVCFLL